MFSFGCVEVETSRGHLSGGVEQKLDIYLEYIYKEVWTGDRNLRVVSLWKVFKAKSL